jgi:ADP-heptose:LPS heptosyltransferase
MRTVARTWLGMVTGRHDSGRIHTGNLRSARSVLVIVFDNIGDVIFTSAVFEVLKTHPQLKVGIWCKNYTEQVARLLPGHPQVFASDPFWDKSPLRGKGRLGAFIRKALEVRRQKFDLAIIPNHCWRSALIAKLLGIPVRIGFGRGKNVYALTHPLAPMNREQAVVPQMLRLLSPFQDVSPGTQQPVYRLELRDEPQLKNPLVNTGKPLVILHPFAGSPKRCAPLSLWLDFALALKDQGFQLLWLGAATELKRLGEHRQAFQPFEYADYYERTGLGDFAGIMQKAYAYVGHDSGPLHFAHGLGAPAFGLYLPSEYKRTFPQGPSRSYMLHRSSPSDLTLQDWMAAWREFTSHL